MKDFLAFTILALLLINGCVSGGTAMKEQSVEEETEESSYDNPKEEETGNSDIEEESYERGGTLKEWQEKLLTATSADSEQSKTAAQCAALMKEKAAACIKHDGWSIDNMVEITDFSTDQHYEFQEVKRQNCPGMLDTDKPPYKVHVDKASFDSQSDNTATSSYQVVCEIDCQWWDCEIDLTGTWSGTYSEISDATLCQYKETGTQTFEITQDDSSFSGTTKFSGKSVVTGGEHCEGGSYSDTGKLSGTISGDKVTGTMTYSTAVPFTATVEEDTMKGTYAYSTSAYGALFSAEGEFELKKQ